MDSQCDHCRQLIESLIISEPHKYLNVLRASPSSSIYRCSLCSTLFEFTDLDIYLLDVEPLNSEITDQKASACA